MEKFKKITKILIVPVLLLTVLFVDLFVYPLTTSHPNYSDVERVFNKMQFPADWQEIDSSENRGIAGRSCPIESASYCYHKSKNFRTPAVTSEQVEEILKQTGCPVVSVKESKPLGDTPYVNFDCSIEGLNISGEVTWENEPVLHIGVKS